MARTDKMQGSLDLLISKVFLGRPNIHGYAIVSAIRQISEEILQVEDGSLYPALHRMEEEGWICAKWTNTDAGVRRRLYELTKAGQNNWLKKNRAGSM